MKRKPKKKAEAEINTRKVCTHDPVVNAVANLYEDVGACQMLLEQGEGEKARAGAQAAMSEFEQRCRDAQAEQVWSRCYVKLAIIHVDFHVVDANGEIRATFNARRFTNLT